ncbi:MAG: serine/threonine protein kinase [Deltaproteobacteria bacterium]|nr:serine/threonine protein kinase [Deltaproteobacteria bacterium]
MISRDLATAPRAPRGARCPNCGDVLPPGSLRCERDGWLYSDVLDPFVGATLAGRYRVIARLGRGGMSSVYLARHLMIDRLAAVKVLRADLSRDPVHRDRFLREARAVNRIQHENVIDITDYGETSEGLVYLVMEYVPGESLLAAITRGPLALRRSLDIARQIASGLARAHQMNVIHRDLKPDNVLLIPRDDRRDQVKLLDFGIAKLLDQPSLTLSNKVFGTPGYIAPEYATGGALTPRTDLYSLGVVLYEMVTGALPFEVEHLGELMLKHVMEAPIPPRARLPSIPEPIERFVLRCLEKQPERRFQNAFELIEQIDALRRDLSGDPVLDALPPPREPAAVMGWTPTIDIPGLDANAVDEGPTRVRSSLVPMPMAPTIPVRASSPNDLLNIPRGGTGVGGVLDIPAPERVDPVERPRTWRHFIDSVTSRLAAVFWGDHPAEVKARLGAMHSRVAAMDVAVTQLEIDRVRALGVEARARELRIDHGNAVDALAAALTQQGRERDDSASRRAELLRRREQLRRESVPGAAAMGASDAILWELAACEETLREQVAACDGLESQLHDIESQLTQEERTLAVELDALIRQLSEALESIDSLDAALRADVLDLDAMVGAKAVDR